MISNGWSVVRFWNTCVLQDRNSVLETLVVLVEKRMFEEVRSRDLMFVPAQKVLDV